MKKFLREIGFTFSTIALCAWLASPVAAVVIEGFTPSGKFKTVALTENAQLNVAVTGGSFLTLSGSAAFTQVTGAGATVTTVLVTNGSRTGELVCNYGTTDVRVGSTTVTAAGPGSLLRGGDDACFSADGNAVYTGALYANATGSYVLDVVEIAP